MPLTVIFILPRRLRPKKKGVDFSAEFGFDIGNGVGFAGEEIWFTISAPGISKRFEGGSCVYFCHVKERQSVLEYSTYLNTFIVEHCIGFGP